MSEEKKYECVNCGAVHDTAYSKQFVSDNGFSLACPNCDYKRETEDDDEKD